MNRKTLLWICSATLLLTAVLGVEPRPAGAGGCGALGSCEVNGVTYDCDDTCINTSWATAPSFAACDSVCTDGKCVLCNVDSTVGGSVTIKGTGNNDVICVRDGNTGTGVENIQAGGGNDIIGTRSDGVGDVIDAGTGNDEIYAGDGDDTITAGGGNDKSVRATATTTSRPTAAPTTSTAREATTRSSAADRTRS